MRYILACLCQIQETFEFLRAYQSDFALANLENLHLGLRGKLKDKKQHSWSLKPQLCRSSISLGRYTYYPLLERRAAPKAPSTKAEPATIPATGSNPASPVSGRMLVVFSGSSPLGSGDGDSSGLGDGSGSGVGLGVGPP